jgi:deazaflavin-dependent oxidoreductase (nitroreductase family)
MASSTALRPPARPRGPLKLFFNLPRLLYRAHLGWLLGHHFLLLTHRGRKSGKARQTVLEVVRYDPATRESVVISAYGDRSDWYRNIQAAPAIEVRTGRDRYVPQLRRLGAEERFAVLRSYRRRYGPLLGLFLRYMGYPQARTEEELRVVASRLHAVGFRPSGSGRLG